MPNEESDSDTLRPSHLLALALFLTGVVGMITGAFASAPDLITFKIVGTDFTLFTIEPESFRVLPYPRVQMYLGLALVLLGGVIGNALEQRRENRA